MKGPGRGAPEAFKAIPKVARVRKEKKWDSDWEDMNKALAAKWELRKSIEEKAAEEELAELEFRSKKICRRVWL